MITINIAKEFSRVPGFDDDGKRDDGSGEKFRVDVLEPAFNRALEGNEKLLVQLDGVRYGYPTYFLDEAFGGLARDYGKELVLKTLRFEAATEPLLDYEIRRYIGRVESTVAPAGAAGVA